MDRDYEWSDVLPLDEKAREYERQGDYAQAAEAILSASRIQKLCKISPRAASRE